MICPKCGFEQPDGAECMRCGIIISRYKGPALGAAAQAGSAAGASSAAMGIGGTVYGDPAPALAAGGTLYGGPPPGAGAPTSGLTQPASRGTLEVGKVLGETFSIYFRNFVPFVLLTCLALSPLILAVGLMISGALAGTGAGMVVVWGLLVVFSLVFGMQLTTASITYGVFQQMRGRDVTIANCLGRGLSALLPVMVLVIVQGIILFFGFLACIIPGILLYLRWAVSVPVAVEERPGVFEAMNRSTVLTEGNRGSIFGILFVIGLAHNIAVRVLGIALRHDPRDLLLALGAMILLDAGISATATAVMYYRLRSIKESIDVDQIASVFA